MTLAALVFDVDVVRLFLHILGASIWVGGQLVVGVLMPSLKGFDGATRAAARRFQWIAWPAFALVVLTGGWNIGGLDPEFDLRSTEYQAFLYIKLLVVAVSGGAAFAHSQATNPAVRGVLGALSSITGLAAMVMGTVLAVSS